MRIKDITTLRTGRTVLDCPAFSLIDDISIALKQNEQSLLLLKIANVAVVGFTYTNLVYAKADGFPC